MITCYCFVSQTQKQTHKQRDTHKTTHNVILLSLTVRSDLRLIEAQAAKKDPSFSGATMYTDEFQTSEVEPTSLLSFILTWMEKILLNSQTFNCVFLSYLMVTANHCFQNKESINQSWCYRNHQTKVKWQDLETIAIFNMKEQ